jgi:hypothetical protein
VCVRVCVSSPTSSTGWCYIRALLQWFYSTASYMNRMSPCGVTGGGGGGAERWTLWTFSTVDVVEEILRHFLYVLYV